MNEQVFTVTRPSTATATSALKNVSLTSRLQSAKQPRRHRNFQGFNETNAESRADVLSATPIAEAMSVKSLTIKRKSHQPNMYTCEGQQFDREYKCPTTNKFQYKMPLGCTGKDKRCNYMTVTTE